MMFALTFAFAENAKAQTCSGGNVPLNGECVSPGEKCEGKGWGDFADADACVIFSLNFATDSGGDVARSCLYSSGGSCYDIFGPDLEFPQKPPGDEFPSYAYNCDTDGTLGLIPATINTVGIVGGCRCASSAHVRFGATTEVVNGVPYLRGGACASPGAAACETAGWATEQNNEKCAVPLASGGNNFDGCFVSGNASPQCADVFGADFSFPPKPAGAAPRYVFNCGSGAHPERHNLSGATVCVPLAGDFAGVSQELLCGTFGGTPSDAGDGRVCKGLDADGTFCILDSVLAFPCRGLFKRARYCNLEHNRPLLNPFTCGRVCASGNARGKGCE